MGIFSKKLERVFPVVKRDYHVCQNGFVQHLVMLKNSYIRDWNNFPIPYVEAVEKYLSTYKGNIHKRILFVTENDMVAVKSALLMKEIYENKYCNMYQIDYEDLFGDDDDDFDDLDEFDFDEGDTSGRMNQNVLQIVSLKQSDVLDKSDVNKYIMRINQMKSKNAVLFTGLSNSEDMNEKLEVIGACPAKMQFIIVSKEQMKEPWVQELLIDFECGILEIDDVEQDYYENVLHYLMQGERFQLAPEISVKMLVHKIRRKIGKSLKEEDLVWFLEEGVRNAMKNHAGSNILELKDFSMLFENDKEPLKKLMEMTGLDSVKNMAKEFAAIVQEEVQNKELGILHKNMIFSGNSGTGKTTCAKLLANIMADEGNTNARFVVATRKDLVAKYIGHTAYQVAEKFEAARGGVLFVDEAGFFLNTNAGGYIQEAIKEFVRYMEIYPDVTVIFAMYTKEVQEFLELDQGLSSRISRFVNFKDYTDEELALIARGMLKEKGYILENEGEVAIKEYMKLLRKEKKKCFGNAREVRKLIEASIIASCVQKYAKKKSKKTSVKEGSKKNVITAQNVRDGWEKLQHEFVKKQEVFGFSNKYSEDKKLYSKQA